MHPFKLSTQIRLLQTHGFWITIFPKVKEPNRKRSRCSLGMTKANLNHYFGCNDGDVHIGMDLTLSGRKGIPH